MQKYFDKTESSQTLYFLEVTTRTKKTFENGGKDKMTII